MKNEMNRVGMWQARISGFLKGDRLFVFVFVLFSLVYYHSILNKGPLNVHLWRQTDCLSLTLNYAKGVPFFQPEMHIQMGDDYTSGKTAGEFPVIYYLVGQLWKIFGQSYFIYRAFYLLILFAGTYAFYRSLRILFGDRFLATVLALLLFTSPVFAYYGVSFMTDVPAFSFVLIALYYLLQYRQKEKMRFFVLSLLFFSLAGLIKVSSLIAFLFLFLILILEIFPFRSLGDKKLFRYPRYELPGFVAVILIIFAWYYYAHYYNSIHHFKYTFNSIYPWWIMNDQEIHKLWQDVRNFTSLVYFSRPVLLLLLVTGIFNLFLWKKIPFLAYFSNIVIIAGSVVYFFLWAPLMGVHDYYYAALLVLFPGILIPFVWYARSQYRHLFSHRGVKWFLALFLFYNFVYCFSVMELKSFATRGSWFIVGNREYTDLMKYTNSSNAFKWFSFTDLKSRKKEFGIGDQDRVISLPDRSFNITLYFMDQKGWTDRVKIRKKEDIEYLIRKGATYLLISDTAMFKKEYIRPFLTHPVGSWKNIDVFKLSE